MQDQTSLGFKYSITVETAAENNLSSSSEGEGENVLGGGSEVLQRASNWSPQRGLWNRSPRGSERDHPARHHRTGVDRPALPGWPLAVGEQWHTGVWSRDRKHSGTAVSSVEPLWSLNQRGTVAGHGLPGKLDFICIWQFLSSVSCNLVKIVCNRSHYKTILCGLDTSVLTNYITHSIIITK